MNILLRLSLILIATLSLNKSVHATNDAQDPVRSVLFSKDTLSLVFTRLDVVSASKVHEVCRKWNEVANGMPKNLHPYFITTAEIVRGSSNISFYLYSRKGHERVVWAGPLLDLYIKPRNSLKFLERIVQYETQVLENGPLKDFKNDIFIQLRQLHDLQDAFSRRSGNPAHSAVISHRDERITKRRVVVNSWQDSSDKAAAYYVLALVTNTLVDLKHAHELYRDLKSPIAYDILDHFQTKKDWEIYPEFGKEEIDRIVEECDRKQDEKLYAQWREYPDHIRQENSSKLDNYEGHAVLDRHNPQSVVVITTYWTLIRLVLGVLYVIWYG